MFAGLSFATPWLLAALVALPLIWWLIRALPPTPRQAPFPPIRLLAGLAQADAPPQAAPWWLLLLRLVMAVLIIAALAGPVWTPPRQPLLNEGGAVAIIIDNGWTAAPDWDKRQQALDQLINRLGAAGRPMLLIPTAPPPGGWPMDAAVRLLSPLAPAEAQAAARALRPHAWPSAPGAIAQWLTEQPVAGHLDSFWLSDGFTSPGQDALIETLRQKGTLHVIDSAGNATGPAAFAHIGLDGADFTIGLIRPPSQSPQRISVQAVGSQGAVYGSVDAVFKPGQSRADIRLTLPPPARQQVTRLNLQGEAHAGGLFLLDDFSARPMVGIAAVETAAQVQPLNSARYYLERALSPYATLSHGPASALAQAGVSVIVMPDSGHLDPGTVRQLGGWIKGGGVLVRFAGPKLAAAQLEPAAGDALDNLLPVRLRPGERAFGGAISWQTEQRLARFAPESPLGLLRTPDDVTVSRQVLAEPTAALERQSWALLEDGTPLITAAAIGQGHLILFHVGANAAWSNLVLSGSFVEILRHILPLGRIARKPLAQPAASGDDPLLTARQHVSGFGTLEPPYPDLGAAPASRLADGASALLPPGLYDGAAGISHAVNLTSAVGPIGPAFRFTPLDALPADVRRIGIDAGPITYAAPLFLTALALFLIDLMAALWLRGFMPGRWAGLAAILILAVTASDRPAAALDEARAVELADAVRLACLESGDSNVDQRCLAGLRGLAAILRIRTAVLAGEPVLVRADDDALGFYPLLYWPVLADAPPLPTAAADNVKTYLRQHGLILFDTGLDGGPAQAQPAMQHLAQSLDLAPWEPLGAEHVLSHSFYILKIDESSNDIWIDAGTRGADGSVATSIAGSAGWASRWAEAPAGATIGAPGRTPSAELAMRFGVNVVVYALTGTYKADQVHVPALLERMDR